MNFGGKDVTWEFFFGSLWSVWEVVGSSFGEAVGLGSYWESVIKFSLMVGDVGVVLVSFGSF